MPGDIRTLGISNIDAPTLEGLYEAAAIKPVVVQNRFYYRTLWDQDVRNFCKEKGIVYQSFWTLTANPHLLKSSPVSDMAQAIGISQAAALYLCVMALGKVSVLNGTTREEVMSQDLASLEAWNHWTAQEGNLERWTSFMRDFQGLIGPVEGSALS